MKKRFFTILLSIFTVFICNSQTFTSTTEVNIPDNTLSYSQLNINGLPNTIDSTNFGIISICVNVLHSFTGQLDLVLRSPNGTTILLANNRGGNGANYANTCFSESGTLPISSGVAPFLGNFIPEQTLNSFNNGQNPNGVWSFGVKDEVPYVTGKIKSFSITFGNNPPPTPIISYCTLFSGKACKCADGTDDCDLLPDMTNSAKVLQTQYYDEPALLHIGVGTPNIGFGPLEMRGTGECYCDSILVNDPYIPCPNGEYPREKVVQRIYHKSAASMTYTDRFSGYMQFHPPHGHLHIDNWTYNTVRIKGKDADPTKWPVVGRDSKVSFCLVNLYNCSANLGYCLDVNGNPISHSQTGNPGLGVVTGCGREQGIFPGYLDIYLPGYDGQELHMDSSICNGVYYVVSVTDPANIVKEMSETNNVAVSKVQLAFQRDGNCCQTAFYADTTLGEAPFTVNFYDTTKPNSKNWFWDFGDGTTDTTQFPTHIYTKPGNYKVSLKTIAEETNCTNTVTKDKYIQVRAKANITNEIGVNIYPNPFSSYINLYLNLKTSQDVSFKVFDMIGRNVYETVPTKFNAGIIEKQYNLMQLKEGSYIIKVFVGEETKQFKVIKSGK